MYYNKLYVIYYIWRIKSFIKIKTIKHFAFSVKNKESYEKFGNSEHAGNGNYLINNDS